MNIAIAQPSKHNFYGRVLYLSLALIMLVTGLLQNARIERSYRREIEYQKQIATLIAENRRLRGNCPTGPTPSGSLVNNQPNRR